MCVEKEDPWGEGAGTLNSCDQTDGSKTRRAENHGKTREERVSRMKMVGNVNIRTKAVLLNLWT